MLNTETRDRMRDLNSKNGYGITKQQLSTLISQHKTARKKNDNTTMEKIEYRLTDINFHSECSNLSRGLYNEARKTLLNW